ncbi:MAG TPA: hypothetical protein VFO69_12425 [Allosphingosinicella sp.]|nr:hypothetical protein [Allosphingosinicella sp.]
MLNDVDPVAEEACVTLRLGLRRGKQLTAEARQRLSELTSNTVYPGLAGVILSDSSKASTDPEAEDSEPASPIPPSLS